MKITMSNVVLVEKEEQEMLLWQAEVNCNATDNNALYLNGTHCPKIWDNLLCWPESTVGMITQLCPNYIHGFTITENASRMCTSTGWMTYTRNYTNVTWTNFTECYKNPLPTPPSNTFAIHPDDLIRIRIIYSVGYGLSLVCLLFAIFIMIFFKKLHCQRNTIHINLFVSFILRAVLAFSRDAVLFDGLTYNDMNYNEEGGIEFIKPGMYWRCRLLVTLLNYAVSVNYAWIFVEGLYLHMLIFVSVFSENSSVRWYIILGWALPLSFMVPWVIVRLTSAADNVMCWNTNPTKEFQWIIKGPIAIIITITFVFFLNIVRVLFTKMNASNTPEARKYRKLAKSTLVLIPLFGAHYIILLAWPDDINDHSHLVKLYFELTTSSIQGFLVALLFCFLNSEVQTEIRKRLNRYKLGRGWSSQHSRMSDNYTYTTYANRRSRAGSTPPPGNLNGSVHKKTAPNDVYLEARHSSLRNCGGKNGSGQPQDDDQEKKRTVIALVTTANNGQQMGGGTITVAHEETTPNPTEMTRLMEAPSKTVDFIAL